MSPPGVTPAVDRPLPPYAQVVQALRTRIIEGELREGDAVPSVRDLAEDWGISRTTATKVHAALKSEGLVRTVPGVGTVVSAHGVGHSPGDRHLRAKRTGKIYPPDQHARILAAEVVTAPDHVAAALGLEPGSQVIRRLRVTCRGDTPVSLSTSWYPGMFAESAPNLLTTERMQGGTAGYIEQATGRAATRGRDQVAGQIANAEVAQHLEIPPGSAVLAGRNWLYDESGSAVEFGEYFHPADRWSSYDYDLS